MIHKCYQRLIAIVWCAVMIGLILGLSPEVPAREAYTIPWWDKIFFTIVVCGPILVGFRAGQESLKGVDY